MSKLSVIVPVYNTKKYLNQCIDSIIGQSYKDIEIIIVDDGSTDGAGTICDSYKEADSRIKVIHQKNKGLLSARLTGVINAEGEYIGFVDSDDWIAGDMYELLMSTAENADCDIVSMGYTIVNNKELREEDDATLFGIFEKGKNMDFLLSNMMYDTKNETRGVHPSLCCKIFAKDLISASITKADTNISLGEDAAIFYPCCLNAERICILKAYKYYYRSRSASICRSFGVDTFEKINYFNQYMKKAFEKYGDKYNLQRQLRMYTWFFVHQTLGHVFELNYFYSCIYPIFPRNVVEKGCDIILYGAGKVGKSYHKQIIESDYCNIIAWADKNANGKEEIIAPAQIKNFTYSKIVIAVYNKLLAEEIAQELTELGIPREKIVWEEPQNPPDSSVSVY